MVPQWTRQRKKHKKILTSSLSLTSRSIVYFKVPPLQGLTIKMHARSQGCLSAFGCHWYQLQAPPLSISTTMAWLSDFQWKQMSTLSLRRTYGTQFLAAEFYFIMSSTLPLWSELGTWKGRGQLSGRAAWVPHIVPKPVENVSFQRAVLQVAFKKMES